MKHFALFMLIILFTGCINTDQAAQITPSPALPARSATGIPAPMATTVPAHTPLASLVFTPAVSATVTDTFSSCPVTTPNGDTPPGATPSADRHGNGMLWIDLWPKNIILATPEFVHSDGSVDMKLGWYRGVSGKLIISGKKLDMPALTVQSGIPEGYGDRGFQPSGIFFPIDGCWEIIGRVGNASLTFVTLVINVSIRSQRFRQVITTPEPSATPALSSCPVTISNGNKPPDRLQGTAYHGDGNLWTALWPMGKIVVRSNQMEADKSLRVKFDWWRSVRGQLTIEGRRLDASESYLETWIPKIYGDVGYQPSFVYFPSEGCWEVTGRVGDASLTFVTLVVKTD